MTEVTRESLAAAPPTICKCGLAESYHRPVDHQDHEYEPRYEPESWREGYRAAMRSLPSPAPEPPSEEDDIDRTILEGAADENRGKDWRSISEPFEERAAQPAPDPEAIRLLRKLLNAIEDSNITPNKGTWDNLDNTAEEARFFLQARESGGEP